jgi:hypothetical protein
MKKIPVDELNSRIADALKRTGEEEPVLLTEDSGVLGMLVPLPAQLNSGSFIWRVKVRLHEGEAWVFVHGREHHAHAHRRPSEFGRCRGMLTIVADDDEHLKDFDEYMR